MRVLLVEDEESLRITLAANLELEGHEAIEACDADEAIALLESQTFDLVLSDIRMPKRGGVDLLQHVKRTCPGLPVVLMTAYANERRRSPSTPQLQAMLFLWWMMTTLTPLPWRKAFNCPGCRLLPVFLARKPSRRWRRESLMFA